MTLANWTAPLAYNSIAIAAPIATPTPGSATILSAPAPDPVQFDYSTQQVLTHQQLNSDFYGLWFQFNATIAALNATGGGAYACGPCITSLSGGTGVSTALGSQASGVGVGAQVSLAHGDYGDLTNAQTIAGAKTFSTTTVFALAGNALEWPSNGGNAGGCANNNGNSAILTRSAGGVQGVVSSLAAFYCAGDRIAFDMVGDAGFGGSVSAAGTMTASNFFTGSRREWKRNIRPLGFDAIAMLRRLEIAQYDCSDARCGAIGTHRIGFIANNAPTVLSGPKHDHFDGGALATVDAAAVRQLAAEIDELRAQVRALKRARR